MKASAAGHFALDDGAGSIKLEIRVQWINVLLVRHLFTCAFDAQIGDKA
jgi:hypothetical protein